MSKAHLQQQTSAPVTGIEDDSADEYVVIGQEEEVDFEKNSSSSETMATNTNLTPSEAQSVTASVATLDAVADIGNGLDEHKLSVSSVLPQNAMSDSNYSQNIFTSSIFVMEDQLRELVRSENEQNRLVLDSIKSALGELTKQKTNNNELISQHKKSIEEALQKIDLSEKLNCEKDERIAVLEQKVEQLTKTLDDSSSKATQLGEELASKDEIIKVLREEIDEQYKMHGTRVKVFRERIDSLEQMLISQQERVEAKDKGNVGRIEDEVENREKKQPDAALFICEKCLNAFPRYGYLYAHYSGCN